MKSSRWFGLALAGILASVPLAASDQIPAKKQDHPIALTGATIYPVSGPAIPNGSILFDKGVIVAVGSSIPYPEGTEVIDITGKHVFPGLISSDTEIGLVEIGAVRATRDQSETGRINPNVRAQAAFNPESEIIPVTRANGITMFVTAPSGGLISGTSAIMLSDGWTWEDMTFKAPAALVVNWPRMTISTAPWIRQSEEEQKKEIAKQLEELNEALRDARSYKQAREADAKLPVDIRWEAMLPFLAGDAPVMILANEIQQIQAAVAWGAAEGLRIII
ncbi:MAG: amidohydrolase, partial [Ignavibacteria bacterium]|nr:amidohydrolase [Ignavibacteria bacterium]